MMAQQSSDSTKNDEEFASAKFNSKRRRNTSVYTKLKETDESDNGCHLKHLFGPPPEHHLGPAAFMCRPNGEYKEGDHEMGFEDPTLLFLQWTEKPRRILVIKKADDVSTTEKFMQLTRWLLEIKNMAIYIESNVCEDRMLTGDKDFHSVLKEFKVCKSIEEYESNIDLIICMGGDGTLLHASSLFQGSCPPIISFHLGTLGFLMPFSFKDFQDVFDRTLNESTSLVLRSRIKSQVLDFDEDESNVVFEYLALNEVVVDRGPSSVMVNLEIFCSGLPLTTLLGDGMIISTPTGSTAYSAAAGASMIHPAVPGIVLTPICPHSLSFRPIVVPAGVELRVKMASTSRHSAWVSFDGRNRMELTRSKCVRITTSMYPLPCVSNNGHLKDWFDSLSECLSWNRVDSTRRKRLQED